MKKQILKKVLEIIFTTVVTLGIFLAALSRGNKSLGIDTFSTKNVVITAIFFAVLGPIFYFIDKRRKNQNSK